MMEEHQLNMEYINRKQLRETSRTEFMISDLLCTVKSTFLDRCFGTMPCAVEKPVDFPSTGVLTGPRSTIFLCSAFSLSLISADFTGTDYHANPTSS